MVRVINFIFSLRAAHAHHSHNLTKLEAELIRTRGAFAGSAKLGFILPRVTHRVINFEILSFKGLYLSFSLII